MKMKELRSDKKLELEHICSMKTYTIEQACLVEDEINKFFYGGANMSLDEDGCIIVETRLTAIEWQLVKSRVKRAWELRRRNRVNVLGETCFEELSLI